MLNSYCKTMEILVESAALYSIVSLIAGVASLVGSVRAETITLFEIDVYVQFIQAPTL